MQSHIVYFANSSGVKVGITRPSQIPTRWIDQGAVQAIPVLRVSSRQISGLAEVVFKAHITDRTQWQKMLKDEQPELDLKEIRDDLMSIVGDELSDLQNKYGLQAVQTLPDEDVQSIEFPVLEYPTKVKSMNFDKTPVIEGLLLGIKGQYLIFDTGVLNMRKFTSYDVELNPVSAGLF